MIILFICLMTCNNEINAQSFSDKKISINIENTSVSSALEMLYKQYDIKLAFSSTELKNFYIKKYSAVNKPVTEIIDNLLLNTGYLYKTIGNQIAIYKSANPVENTSKPAVSPESKKTKPAKQISIDTVYITDTVTVIKNNEIIKIDTIVKTEIVRVVDTVVVYKDKPAKLRLKSFANNFFAKDYSHNQKFSARLSYSQQYCNLSLSPDNSIYDEYCSLFDKAIDNQSFKNFQIDIEGGYTYKNWDFSVGISYNNIQNKFSFSESIWDLATNIIDTIDSYYVINPVTQDTTYFYIFDTITTPPTEYQYHTNDINKLSYLGVNISAAYTFYHSERIKLYLKAGIGVNFLIKAEGSYIVNTPENKIRQIDNDFYYSNRISYMLGFGTRFALTESLDFVPEVYYKKYNNSLIKDNHLDAKLNSIGIKVGFFYYF